MALMDALTAAPLSMPLPQLATWRPERMTQLNVQPAAILALLGQNVCHAKKPMPEQMDSALNARTAKCLTRHTQLAFAALSILQEGKANVKSALTPRNLTGTTHTASRVPSMRRA
jgi:hypothetical protein